MHIGDLLDTCLNSKAWNECRTSGLRVLDVARLVNPCNRALQYEAQGVKPCSRQRGGHRTVRVSDMTAITKDLACSWLNEIGLKVLRRDAGGLPFGYQAAKGKMVGCIDGVVVSGPKKHQYPCLWFCLPMSGRRYREIRDKGLEGANTAELGLIALHQKYMDLTQNPALLTLIDKEGLEMDHTAVPFNQDRSQTMNDRAAMILMACRSGERLPRLTSNPGHYECRWCGFRTRCWESI